MADQNSNGGINRSGSGTLGDPWSYSVRTNYDNRPVTRITWYTSLRFTNWMHNGQGSGDTEDGAYDMSLGFNVVRKPDAQVWLPDENEWYKAAYFTSSGYSSYAHGVNTPPVPLVEANYAQLQSSFDWAVGTGTVEQNGTFDMMGNVGEWNETLITGDRRGLRGGAWYNQAFSLVSTYRDNSSPDIDFNLGFRVASIPEPCSLVLLSLGGLIIRKRKS